MLTYADLSVAYERALEFYSTDPGAADRLRERRKIREVDERGRETTVDLRPRDRFSVCVRGYWMVLSNEDSPRVLAKATQKPLEECPVCQRPNPADTAQGKQCWWCGHTW